MTPAPRRDTWGSLTGILASDRGRTLKGTAKLEAIRADAGGPFVALTKKAVEAEPQSRGFHNTLGVAEYRAGEWKPALAHLETSVRLSKGGSAEDFFFLAMAHWQLGEKDDARQWYGRAVAWTDKNRPTDPQLRGFRAEAAALVGPHEKKDKPGTR